MGSGGLPISFLLTEVGSRANCTAMAIRPATCQSTSLPVRTPLIAVFWSLT
jgi:hypothetical protein